MRRMTLLGLTLLLPACQSYVGNPFDGFGGFIGDTHSFHGNPNRPVGDSANMLRVEGKDVEQEPLTPEPGNVWPRPAAAEPTLQDLQREQPAPDLNGQPPPPSRPIPRGSSTPPAAPPELTPPEPATQPPPPAALPPATAPTTKFYPTPGGTAVAPPTGNGVQTYTDPKGGTGIVVPNGNGTSTLIGPDGSVTTVPTPH